jgi:hypothetical protein
MMSKIKKRTEFSSIVKFANANPFTIHMVRQMKAAGMKVVMEIPTYPYDSEYKAQRMSKQIFQDKIFRNHLAKELDAIVTFSDYPQIFGQRTIRISNGIDFGHVNMKTTVNDTSQSLNLIGVAEIHRWHGFDRLVRGLAAYYSQPQNYIVKFHVVGYFYSAEGEAEFKQLIADNRMEDYVILYGKKHGEELDKLFNICDFGIGSLGRHRVGIQKIKTLKNREYAARGIPFTYSETDSDFDDRPYVLKMPANESPVDIQEIIRFHQNLSMSAAEIRDSIKDLSWEHQMKRVISETYK